MTLDFQKLRTETPGCGSVVHFNHASCSLPPERVLDAITGHLRREALEGPSEAGAAAAPAIAATREAAARLVNCSADEIALVGSGSQGWGSAFAALPPLKPGDRIIVGRHEWGGNLATIRLAADRAGALVEIAPSGDDGTIDPERLRRFVDGRTKLIAVTWFPATYGVENPAAEIGVIAREAGVPYFVDAGQALGQAPVDVQAVGCDVLKGAGRKFLRGPRGTALLYVRRDFANTLTPGYADVSSAPWGAAAPEFVPGAARFETAEKPMALLMGMGEALRLNSALTQAAITSAVLERSDMLRDRLKRVPGLNLIERETARSALSTAVHDRLTPDEVRQRLAAQRINVAAIAAAYGPLDLPARGLDAVLRFSVSYLTTEAEIAQLAEALAAL